MWVANCINYNWLILIYSFNWLAYRYSYYQLGNRLTSIINYDARRRFWKGLLLRLLREGEDGESECLEGDDWHLGVDGRDEGEWVGEHAYVLAQGYLLAIQFWHFSSGRQRGLGKPIKDTATLNRGRWSDWRLIDSCHLIIICFDSFPWIFNDLHIYRIANLSDLQPFLSTLEISSSIYFLHKLQDMWIEGWLSQLIEMKRICCVLYVCMGTLR